MNKKNRKSGCITVRRTGEPAIGMGADLWDLTVATKHIWDCASDVSGIDIRRLCLKGPMNRLIQTTVQQLAVTAINVTLYTLCQQKKLIPVRLSAPAGTALANIVPLCRRCTLSGGAL